MRHPSTTFAKVVLCFSRRFEQERQAKLEFCRVLMNSENCSWSSFSPFSAQNLKFHLTWKLCSSKNWTTFILVEFEVFRWNLENAAKVPEDIHRRQWLSRVWPCLWPKVDHGCVLTWPRGSIGFVGEVFRGDDPGEPRFDQCRQVWPSWFGH
jgi:hypothetical protein